MTRCPRASKAAATSPAISRRSGSPTVVRRQPVSSRLGSPHSSCAMSARVARRPWSKLRSSAIWRTTPEHTATAAGGAGASLPSEGIRIWSGGRARPRSMARRISAARPWARWRPSTPRVPRSSSPLRGGRCEMARSPRSESTMRRGRLVSAAVRSRHAATSWATARERRDMPRMSPSFHHASSGTRAGVRSPSTWSHSFRAHSRRPSARSRSVSTSRSSSRWATSLRA